MKILHLVKSFSPTSQTFVYDLLVALRTRGGIEQSIVAAREENRRMRPFSPVTVIPAFDLVAGLVGRGRLHRRGVSLVMPIYRLVFQRTVARFAPDVIHCHFGWAAVALHRLGGNWARSYRVVVGFHGTDITSSPVTDYAYASDLLKVAKYPFVRTTVVSSYLRQAALKIGIPESQLRLHPNGLNPNFLGVRSRPLFRPGDVFRVISIGRFVPWKGQRILIDAFAAFVRDVPNATLTLIGEGETLGQLRDYVRHIGLDNRISFPGEVAHSAIPLLLSDSDAYVQPSLFDNDTGQVETFGVAALEAIACGVPVVVTDTGGLVETVSAQGHEGSSYFVVRPADSSAIQEKLLLLARSERNVARIDCYSRERREYFSQQRQIESYIGLYKELVAG